MKKLIITTLLLVIGFAGLSAQTIEAISDLGVHNEWDFVEIAFELKFPDLSDNLLLLDNNEDDALIGLVMSKLHNYDLNYQKGQSYAVFFSLRDRKFVALIINSHYHWEGSRKIYNYDFLVLELRS